MNINFPANIGTIIAPEAPTSTANYKQISVTPEGDIGNRVMEALVLGYGYIERMSDPESAEKARDRLAKSSVRGSYIQGINGQQAVMDLLQEVYDWRQVETEKDPHITVLQGSLPQRVIGHSYAAYSTIRQLHAVYGLPGLSTLQVKQGHQRKDEFYLCTTLKMPTSIITVQLRNDSAEGPEFEYLHQWFAGPELSSLIHEDDGDTVVRAGVVIPYVNNNNGYERPQRSSGYNRGYKHSA